MPQNYQNNIYILKHFFSQFAQKHISFLKLFETFIDVDKPLTKLKANCDHKYIRLENNTPPVYQSQVF